MNPRVLYISHGHPKVIAGGAEVFAYELFKGMREDGRYEPYFMARMSTPPKDGSPLTTFAGPDEFSFHAPAATYDYFLQSQQEGSFPTVYFRDLLELLSPQVVHFQHTLHLGLELIQIVRMVLPTIPIIYTLHEYIPICFADGQMRRRTDGSLCDRSSPQRCHECFPERSDASFKMRELFIKRHFDLVDRFVAPSHFLRDRYVEWGLSPDKVETVDYGRRPQKVSEVRELGRQERRSVFGYFGQLNEHKGVLVLLDAMKILIDQGIDDVHLYLHGANLDLQSAEFREQFHQKLRQCGTRVTFGGEYRARDLSRLMGLVDWVVVPSIWWENSPLVIQEAFLHRRPVICSDIGGMAEKVRHGQDGLHFHANSAHSLADVMKKAVQSEEMWARLHSGIGPVFGLAECVETHVEMYRSFARARG